MANRNNITRCEKMWTFGILNSQDIPIENRLRLLEEHQCNEYNSWYYLIDFSKMRLLDFIESIPILYVTPKDEGLYTWIVYSNEHNNFQFAACKSVSYLEYGTRI